MQSLYLNQSWPVEPTLRNIFRWKLILIAEKVFEIIVRKIAVVVSRLNVLRMILQKLWYFIAHEWYHKLITKMQKKYIQASTKNST